MTKTRQLHEPTSLWTDADRAWMAGFFEGEGSVRIGPSSGTLSIKQVNPEPLVKVMNLCGGTVTIEKRDNPNHNPILIWAAYGKRARKVAREIFPFLSTKRRAQLCPLIEWQPVERAPMSQEARERIAAMGRAYRGKPKPPEQRAKMSAARKAWWAKRKAEQ